MGQHAIGLLYGCDSPELPDPEGDGEPHCNLIDRWEKAKKISYHTKGLKIRHESEGGKDLLGVWVAVGGSGEDGAAYLLDECVRFHEVCDVYADDIAKATKLWERFAKWVKAKEGIELPQATLWLTPCEVA